MINTIHSIGQLNEALQEENVSLFGAGHASNYVVKYASQSGYEIGHIYVSFSAGNPEDILGVRVMALDTLLDEFAAKTSLIVCLTEKYHPEVADILRDKPLRRITYLSDSLLRELKYHSANYDVRTLEAAEGLYGNVNYQADRLLRFMPKPCLEYMIVNILDHCNLRCKGCDHFACIADEKFYSFKDLSRDIRRMAEIFHSDYIMKIAVMGGEPLLHPELLEILKEIRSCFPHCTIRLSTNGLLLLQQKQDFWNVCRENRVTIVNTKYPINLNHEDIKKKACEERVDFQYFEGSGDGIVKHSFKKIINLKGDSNPADSFSRCHISNYGNFLLEGRFYGCPFSAQSFRIFNKKFDQNLRMTEDDYLDIYKVESKKEFFEFAARPKYYCRYCQGLSPLFPWSRSEGKITEWIEE